MNDDLFPYQLEPGPQRPVERETWRCVLDERVPDTTEETQ